MVVPKGQTAVRTETMFQLQESKGKRLCALMALIAVMALVVSVATRYTATRKVSSSTVSTVQKNISGVPSRQRLLKNAATWVPPVVEVSVLDVSTPYPRIAPAGPPIPNLLLEKNLYNRPPPSVNHSSRNV
jgi:hypothetical protein